MIATGICALCGKKAKLEKSHWIPRFATDWLKKNSMTGYLRSGKVPNVRQQDSIRASLLCGACERRFSVWEGAFSKRIYLPFRDQEQASFEYREWLLCFAVSLAWRTTVRTSNKFQKEHPTLAPQVAKALSTWRTYLLQDNAEPGSYEHHMFFFPDVIAQAVGTPYPDGMNAYCLSGIDSTIASTETAAYAYTLLPGIAFWSCIHPTSISGWEGTIIGRTGTISTPQRVTWPDFGRFVLDRATWMRQRMQSMSEKQHDLIRQTVLQNPDRAANSKGFEIQLRERYWRKSE